MTENPAKPATPRQLVFECKLQAASATLQLLTHGGVKDGVHRWTQLSGGVFLKQGKARVPVRIVFAMADLSECRLARWSTSDTVWIGRVAFDLDRAEIARITEFLVGLGIEIEDNTKGARP